MTPGDSFYLYSIGTVSSAGLERCLDRAEVAGSNPARFTLRHKAPTGAFLFILLSSLVFFCCLHDLKDSFCVHLAFAEHSDSFS